MVTLIKGDCMDLMRDTPNKFYSLAIVDVPYGIGANKMTLGNGKHKIERGELDWDNAIPSAEYWNELFRVSKNQIIWGGNYMTEYLRPSRGWIVWDKGTGENDFADGELAWTSFDRVLKIFKYSWVGANAKNETKRIHICEKPVQLYKYILKNYAKHGDTILDTHGGSFSSVIACADGGFDVDCCEIDSQYFEAGVKRVQNHMAQLDCFIERPEIKIIR